MFERFTQEARQVVVWAQEEARSLGHNYIGTEHVLLGLLRQEQDGRDGDQQPLGRLGVTLSEARERIVRIVGHGEGMPSGQIPFTPRAKKVLELALREALGLGHNWIDPDHILLGITREGEGVASRVLLELDVDSESIRREVVGRLANAPHRQRAIDPAWFDGLVGVLGTLADQIRGELGREPDLSDLLLTIACARQRPAGQALRELGIDLDALWSTLERTRLRLLEEREDLIRKIGEVRQKKDLAIEEQRFDEAAQFRDRQRELTIQLNRGANFEDDVLREVRRRLGLSEEDS
jgi:ATP-dependent Clp protease ATP-binding subunit ClpA